MLKTQWWCHISSSSIVASSLAGESSSCHARLNDSKCCLARGCGKSGALNPIESTERMVQLKPFTPLSAASSLVATMQGHGGYCIALTHTTVPAGNSSLGCSPPKSWQISSARILSLKLQAASLFASAALSARRTILELTDCICSVIQAALVAEIGKQLKNFKLDQLLTSSWKTTYNPIQVNLISQAPAATRNAWPPHKGVCSLKHYILHILQLKGNSYWALSSNLWIISSNIQL